MWGVICAGTLIPAKGTHQGATHFSPQEVFSIASYFRALELRSTSSSAR